MLKVSFKNKKRFRRLFVEQCILYTYLFINHSHYCFLKIFMHANEKNPAIATIDTINKVKNCVVEENYLTAIYSP